MVRIKKCLFLTLCFVVITAIVVLFSNQIWASDINGDYDEKSLGTAIDEPSIEITQIDESTKTNIKLINCDTLVFNSVEVTAKVIYKEQVKRSVVNSFDLSYLQDNEFSAEMDFKDYATFHVFIKFKNSDNVVYVIDDYKMSIIASTYNIGSFVGTMAVSMFTLDMWGSESPRHDGPAILQIQRHTSYNWNNLLQETDGADGHYFGMFLCPYITKEEMSAINYFDNYLVMSDYVRDLYGVSQNSKFNFFFTDWTASLADSFVYANKISEYSIYFLSDGSSTYDNLKSNFDKCSLDENNQIHDEKIQYWNDCKSYSQELGQVSKLGADIHNGRQYLFAAPFADENIHICVNSKSDLKTKNDNNDFGKFIQNSENIKEWKLSKMFNDNLTSQSSQDQLKNLYNFNDNFFEKAQKLGKKVLMIIGSNAAEPDDVDLDDYLRLILSYYGEENSDYCYYYKGHPACPTIQNPLKMELLNNLDVDDIDSSIPAELIKFFNPDIYFCGYNSSFFDSVESGKDLCMFRMNKSQGQDHPYVSYHGCDFWASAISDNSPENIKDLCKAGKNFLVEFKDSICSDNDYDIAIWNSDNAILEYYKYDQDLDVYAFVKSEKGKAKPNSISSGQYAITSILDQHKSMDLYASSHDDTAPIIMFDYFGTNNQMWKVKDSQDGYVYIYNQESGKVLDIPNSNVYDCVHVQQYEFHGGDNQKWKILNSPSGYQIVPKLEPSFVLDIEGGSAINLANLILYRNNFTSNQFFKFSQINPEVKKSDENFIDGFYKIKTSLNSNYCADVEHSSVSNNAKVSIYDDINTNMNQVFNIERQDNGYHVIKNVVSDKVLTFGQNNIYTESPLMQQDYNASELSQLWSIQSVDSSYYIIQNVANGYVIDVCGGKAYPGTSIISWPLSFSNNQYWFFSPVSNPYSSLNDLASKNAKVLSDGYYQIVPKVNNDITFDVYGGSCDDGAPIQLFNNNITENQIWKISHDNNGYVLFQNLKSKKMLDLIGSYKFPGCNLCQYLTTENNNQKWIVEGNNEDGYKIRSGLMMNLNLSIPNEIPQNCDLLQTWYDNDSILQRFDFIKVDIEKQLNAINR